MGVNSPLPAPLQEESRKAAKILRSFVDSSNNGLDKVIPQSVLQKASGFAIFTVFKAGFLFSARAGSGVVIARTPDGTWSPPSAIGLGGFGFGGQLGAEVTDFLIVLNSQAAVKSFMAAGSLTLGGNLSVAVGPLGRNAEGSGALSTKGKVAAMYSYSKTKGLFGGVSVEGSIILERQDANRLAYGGNPSSKQILSGAFDAPDWAGDLISAIERYTGLPGGQRWQNYDEDGEGGGMGHGVYSPGGGEPSGYVFGGETGGQGSPNAKEADKGGRRRGASVGVNDRPPSAARRLSAMNPFGSGNSSPKKAVAGVGISSSENYNAGLTWDSDGPMSSYGNRSRSGSSALRPGIDLETRARSNSDPRARRGMKQEDGLLNSEDDGLRGGGDELMGTWGPSTDDKGLSNSFARLRTDSIGSNQGGRSRSNSKPPLPSLEENEYIPYETESKFAVRFGKNGSARNSPLRIHDDIDPFGGESSTSGRAFEAYQQPLPSNSSPSRTAVAYASPNRRALPPQSPPISSPRSTPTPSYARAVALFDLPAGQEGDLALKKGGIIFAMDKLGGGDWWRGMNAKGEVGIFPATYIEVVEIPKDIKGGLNRGDLKKRVLVAEFD